MLESTQSENRKYTGKWGTPTQILVGNEHLGTGLITADGNYSCDASDLEVFNREFGSIYSERKLDMQLKSVLIGAFQQACGELGVEKRLSVLEIINSPEKVSTRAKEIANQNLSNKGVIITHFSIENIALAQESPETQKNTSGNTLAIPDMGQDASENAEKSVLTDDRKIITSPMIRGSLKIEISTSTNLISAGKEFSIYVVIHNPFDVPITLHRTETHIPVELSDEIARFKRDNRIRVEQNEVLSNTKSAFERARKRVGFWISNITESRRAEKEHRVAEAVGVEYERVQRGEIPTISIAGTESSIRTGDVIGNQWNLDFANMSQDEVRQILWDIEQYIQGKNPVILQPGNSVVRHFVLRTTNWLLFAPLAHTFQIQVTYDVAGKYQIDTVPFSVNIQASMFSALVGSVVGSILGSFVRTSPSAASSFEIIRVILTSAIFAVIIVVAFARKSNVQQIISIEDFWGGIFIGFLTGYVGESFVTSIIGYAGAG